MPNFGTVLGAYGNSYPQYQQNQQMQEMNALKMKQALQQMALDQQNRQAQSQAIQAAGKMQPSGPGGSYSPQQQFQLANGNPQALEMFKSQNPYAAGGFNMMGRDISGQYGNQRANIRSDAEQNVADTRANAMTNTQDLRNTGNVDVQKLRNEGAANTQDIRNTGMTDTQKIKNERPTAAAAGAKAITSSPEYKTAAIEYDNAKKDERNIEAHYPNIARAYSDPQWIEARQRSIAAQKKMEAIQTKADKETPAAPAAPAASGQPVKITSDDDYSKLPSGTQFVAPDGSIRTKP